MSSIQTSTFQIQDWVVIFLIAMAALNGFQRGPLGAVISGLVSLIPACLLQQLIPYLPKDAESIGALILGIVTSSSQTEKMLFTMGSISVVFVLAKMFLLAFLPKEVSMLLPGGMIMRIAGVAIGAVMEGIVLAKYYSVISMVLETVQIPGILNAWNMLTATNLIQKIAHCFAR